MGTIPAGPDWSRLSRIVQTTAYQLSGSQYLSYVISLTDVGGVSVPRIEETAATGIEKALGKADAGLAMPVSEGIGK